MNLMQTYFEAIEIANERELTKFCFQFENKIYLVEWSKTRWNDPEELVQI
jgi:hypothetical protein